MNQEEPFIQDVKKIFGIQSLSEEQKAFLEEIFQEINVFLENTVYGTTYYDVLFSEVETNQIFQMGGEDYCKISDSEYLHLHTRITSTMIGDPVVIIWMT
ncbi:MAG: hypothetical protein JJU37_12940 [Balneolaceae bacterium]|nr:hypothetical protein [Balneolaceae bacterium]